MRRVGVFPHLYSLGVALRPARRLLSGASLPAVNLYKRLRVDTFASDDELRAAYRQRALECHPDVVEASAKTRAEAEFRAVSEAYEVLRDPTRRALHDKALGLHNPPKPDAAKHPLPKPKPSKRRSFVRGDADRMFREAFDGMTLDQLLFRTQRERRCGANAASVSGAPAGREATMRRVLSDAAARFATRLRRQYGATAVSSARLRSAVPLGPTPRAGRMPFRPFRGWTLPADVHAMEEPKPGPISHLAEEGDVRWVEPWGGKRELPRHFPRLSTADGQVLGHGEMLRHLEMARHEPHNMGKLYSFHRPY